MNVLDFARRKSEGRKISLTTAYDFWTARILNASSVDAILVGDSVAMVMHGFQDTTAATVDMMVDHTAAVSRGAPDTFIVTDLPFLSYHKGLPAAMDAVHRLIQAGANAVKLEGVHGQEDLIRHIVQAGVPVMGHIGLTPQSVHRLGGYRVQGRSNGRELIEAAQTLEACGCFAVVIELVPSDLAAEVTDALTIPTIGIGAGPKTDGQILVLHDLSGFNSEFSPKFVRKFADGEQLVLDAVNAFADAVSSGDFPAADESYDS